MESVCILVWFGFDFKEFGLVWIRIGYDFGQKIYNKKEKKFVT